MRSGPGLLKGEGNSMALRQNGAQKPPHQPNQRSVRGRENRCNGQPVGMSRIVILRGRCIAGMSRDVALRGRCFIRIACCSLIGIRIGFGGRIVAIQRLQRALRGRIALIGGLLQPFARKRRIQHSGRRETACRA